MQRALENSERLDYVFEQARHNTMLIFPLFWQNTEILNTFQYDVSSYLTPRELDPSYGRLLNELDEDGEVSQTLWRGLTNGRVVRADPSAVAEYLVDIDFSKKVSVFSILFKTLLECELHFAFPQFLSTLRRAMRLHLSAQDYNLPGDFLVHRGVVANGPFMKQPGILRADKDFMVNHWTFQCIF